MLFPAPDGATLVSSLATGTMFMVGLVRVGHEVLVCKRLLPRMREEPAARAALAREALLLSRAHHHALPELRRVGSDDHGPFLIETRAEGVSLRALVEGWREREKPVPPRLVAHVAAAAATALAELHELADARGPILLAHGDLAPEHVFLGPLGDVRFVDLGAARFAGMDPALHTSDRGTLPFAAPEVARGEVAPGQAGDVYALAATLIYLATGGPLCAAQNDAAMLLEIGERGLSPALGGLAACLPEAARDALSRATRLDPAERLARARDLAVALSG